MNTLTIGSADDKPKSVTINTLGVVIRKLREGYADTQVTASLSPIADLKGSTPGAKYWLQLDIPQTIVLSGRKRRKVSSNTRVHIFMFLPVEG
ncbi:TPA_asm: hypothetical protein [ssRNA phage Gerhypos.1_30]|uniref:Uncharacterized protein n=2 Tax=Leviviricetes TaxID=2842243 RepID=A0A8S5L4A1_9VIRU|nr:hypothetical protein QIR80_gp3 [ssRNA phage Gerhypos.1_30]QDH87971.1 MAG: hypothetical protein H1Bulk30112_000002 [Leviviridae sp.]DAD52018.1 TPA_asm: hypothetical protein [ssRNA phage Gerhypos.1_30]